MDALSEKWLKGKVIYWFRRQRKLVERNSIGKILNVGCGSHIIKGAVNIDENATNLPFDNESFDTVILAAVVEHIPGGGDRKAIEEAYRVARKRIILTVPLHRCLWSEYDILVGHYRRYSERQFIKMCKEIVGDSKIKMKHYAGMILPLILTQRKIFKRYKTTLLPDIIDNILYYLSYVPLPFSSMLYVEINKND